MSNTAHLNLPVIAAAQSQKHVTHNEALALIDLVVQLSVISNSVGEPPADPTTGARYIVPAGATGAFAGYDNQIAAFDAGAWRFIAPGTGWCAWVESAGGMQVYSDGAWGHLAAVAGLGIDPGTGGLAIQQEATVLSETDHGAQSQFVTVEEELSLAGGSVSSTIVIPDRAIVFCVSSRTVEDVTGVWQYHAGIAGEAEKFGGYLGVAEGATNAGVIGPQAFYADTPVVITAHGDTGAFTGGKVRIALHYFLPVVATS
ncbi:hypothetical protein PsAD2_04268 [Pseudovibrio axinellae]|uniref:Uncharacterized protein n=1 Tax=Pseudovibrio axinellae TaxID=989403 RepID=A0A165TX31_9HYPH|nr:DUF2793 domain-containing protein [Pseudovibrio axinellae]KZL06755.1 hypothetical protein PsAD2_04268 [Pseudovibrio axinellae]SER63067.1 Protein of unknown function [Pseudovibrio axinellae]